MKPAALAGHGTDRGRVREQNEDAYIADPQLGVFCVVDGMGGHAGGQVAAKIAVEQIRRRMRVRDKDPETRVREAIALAGRAIHKERGRRPEFAEMACVLTLAAIDGQQVTVGHVGDTRLYKIRERTLTPVTSDHSPVGMLVREHRLSEVEAMKHPNRNLVSRDVGSADRQPFAPEFIDTHSFRLEPDAAVLICSDGLCDQVTPETILAAIRRHAHDPQAAVDTLIRLANDAGGKDNVTAILVCGREFAAENEVPGGETTERLGFDGAASDRVWRRRLLPAALVLLAAAAGGILAWKQPWRRPVSAPPVIYVDPEIAADGNGHFRTLASAIESAPPGSVIRVLNGRHAGPIALRAGVQLQAAGGRDVTLFLRGVSPAVITADALLEAAVVDGFRIVAKGAQAAVEVRGSWVVLRNNTISGASEAAVRTGGGSTVELSGNRIECGPGTVGLIAAGSALDVRGNQFFLVPGTPRPMAVEVGQAAGDYRIVLEQNELLNCRGECVSGVRDWRLANDVSAAPGPSPGSQEKQGLR